MEIDPGGRFEVKEGPVGRGVNFTEGACRKMPTYDYQCEACGKIIEVFHPMSASGPEFCDCEKHGRMRRLVSAGSGLIFKGSGFYITDYARKDGKNGGNGAGSSAGTSPAASKSESGSGDSSAAAGSTASTASSESSGSAGSGGSKETASAGTGGESKKN